MSLLPAALKESSRFLRRAVFANWLQAMLLLSGVFMLANLVFHQRRIVNDAEHTIQGVVTVMRAPIADLQRQYLIESYAQFDPGFHSEGINVVMVVDRRGRIIYSSRPTWRGMAVDDPQFERLEGDDPDFRAVVTCFRERRADCMEFSSVDWHLHFEGVTVVRPRLMPAPDLGLARDPYLVLINFDAGMLFADFIQDLPLLLLVAAVSAAVLSAGLALILSGRLLPQLIEATQTDTLTQLMNRTSFMELAMDLLAEAEERKGELVFAILDLDHFKQINDTYGHGCGDAALACVGSLLMTVTRPDDLVCRFGGEEFAMILSTPKPDAAKVLERLRLQVEMNHLLYQGHRIPMTVSIGAAATRDCGYNLDYLYNAADKALYGAKHGGRNRLAWNSGELVSRLPSPYSARRSRRATT